MKSITVVIITKCLLDTLTDQGPWLAECAMKQAVRSPCCVSSSPESNTEDAQTHYMVQMVQELALIKTAAVWVMASNLLYFWHWKSAEVIIIGVELIQSWRATSVSVMAMSTEMRMRKLQNFII